MTPGLPSLGGPDDAFDAPPLARAPEARLDPGRPVVAVVGVAPTSPAVRVAADLARALDERGRSPAALLLRRAKRSGELTQAGADHPVVIAGASPVWTAQVVAEEASGVLDEAWRRLPAGRPVVSVGCDVPALYRSALTIVVSGGLAPFAWAASARAVRDRLDVELCDPRPGFARELVRRWVG